MGLPRRRNVRKNIAGVCKRPSTSLRAAAARRSQIELPRHRETWHKDQTGWRGYDVSELGGKIWVNGKLYQPRGGH
jgi:hypothetical protein